MQRIKLLKVILILLIVSVLVFSGCRGEGRSLRTKTENFRTGTEGIVMRFIPNAPPAFMFTLKEGNRQSINFSIAVELQNKGLTPSIIPKGYADTIVLISGFDQSIIDIEDGQFSFDGNIIDGKQLTDPSIYNYLKEADAFRLLYNSNWEETEGFLLYGKDEFNLEGNMIELRVDNVKAEFPNNLPFQSYTTDLLVDSCYLYSTEAIQTVCMDPNYFDENIREGSCRVQDYSLGGSQGAPVAVSYIRSQPTTDKMHFYIYIKNVGGGDVVDSNFDVDPLNRNLSNWRIKPGVCPTKLRPNDLDFVYVTARVSNQPLKCRALRELDITREVLQKGPGGEYESALETSQYARVRLVNGEGKAICTKEGYDSPEAYSAPLYVRVDYGYHDEISKKVEFRQAP